MKRTVLVSSLLVLLGAASCGDPVRTDAVEELGPEVAGVREGPTHRAGQPCIVCHGATGPGEPEFSIGGTVYVTRGQPAPAAGATVTLTDATGSQRQLVANQVGNFYIERKLWDPVFPIRARVDYAGTKGKDMETRINGNGGCGFCHRGSGDPSHVVPVYAKDL